MLNVGWTYCRILMQALQTLYKNDHNDNFQILWLKENLTEYSLSIIRNSFGIYFPFALVNTLNGLLLRMQHFGMELLKYLAHETTVCAIINSKINSPNIE